MLLVDEASRVPEDLYLAMRPVLAASDGDLWLVSTPFGRRGFFFESWTNGGPAWHRIQVPATECPRIRPDKLAADLQSMGTRPFGGKCASGIPLRIRRQRRNPLPRTNPPKVHHI